MISLPPTLQSGQVVATLTIEPSGPAWYFGTPAMHRVSVWTLLKRTGVCVDLQMDDLLMAHDDNGVAIAETCLWKRRHKRENR